MNFQQELESLIALVSNVADSFTTTLFLADQQKQELRLASFHTLGNSVIQGTVIPYGHGLVGWVANHCQAVNVSEFNRDTKTLQFYSQDEEIKSFMAVPVVEQELLGVLCIDSKKQYVFTPKLQKLLQGFADQAALVLRRQQVFEQQQSLRASIETLYEYCRGLHERIGAQATDRLTLARHLCRLPRVLIEHDECAVCLRAEDHPEQQFVAYRLAASSRSGVHVLPVAMEQSLSGIVLRKGEPLYLPDVHDDGRRPMLFAPGEERPPVGSFLGVPILYGGGVHGAMIFTCAAPYQFSRSHAQLTQILGFQVVAALSHDSSAKREHEAHLIDGLTGLLNRRAFEEALSKRLARIDTQGGSLALLAIDPDGFSAVNETVGYEAGDAFLLRLARLLGNFALGKNLLGRFESDCFLLAIEGTSFGDSLELAEKIRRTVEGTLFQSSTADKMLTVTIGAAFYPADAESQGELMRAVRRAVASAKRRGKNRVEAFAPAR
ncbi:MAG: diguanylate cyclase [Candidatus Tectomicrobia bacterium]|nr:diguanylate cyclase [Candidatus Tectomicrobia bacterium]